MSCRKEWDRRWCLLHSYSMASHLFSIYFYVVIARGMLCLVLALIRFSNFWKEANSTKETWVTLGFHSRAHVLVTWPSAKETIFQTLLPICWGLVWCVDPPFCLRNPVSEVHYPEPTQPLLARQSLTRIVQLDSGNPAFLSFLCDSLFFQRPRHKVLRNEMDQMTSLQITFT